ncbi:DUF1661 domain-containing protein [Porphyromonas gingivalis]|uniref:DUF1661 domain-containing protein n=1 Tax=Porphyromonas gingivalis TaxID=837 RepID=A0AAE9XCA1_PORGN|nr:DUF1661 domain-containing protein [Porphyromonas gingivalis]WCG04053.1 DUF1661 domain-containing protein [Porphyromonas gingivalis]
MARKIFTSRAKTKKFPSHVFPNAKPPFETFARRLVCVLFVNSLYNRELFCIFEH